MPLQQLAARAISLLAARGSDLAPVMIGISGAPGAGKTTLAKALVQRLSSDGYRSAYLPMDGFHLADVELERLGRRDRKGAIDTFDGGGFVALLRRIREQSPQVIYAPAFERTLEQPLAGSIPLLPGTQIVVTEGNYLLSPEAPWNEIPTLLDEVWHCLIADTIRRERLIARHVEFGKSPLVAQQWVDEVDEGNAKAIEKWRHSADLLVDCTEGTLVAP